MSRVDENREAQRAAEQRRLEEQNRVKQQAQSDQFKKVVEQKQAGVQQAQGKQSALQQGKAKVQGQAGAQGQARASASTALLARQGIQSRGFSETLHKRGEVSSEKARVESKDRRDDLDQRDARSLDRNQQLDREDRRGAHDPLGAIAGDEQPDKGTGGEGGGAMDMGGQQQPGFIAQPQSAQAAAPGAGAPRLPPEVIQKLVERVFAGVTPEGLCQFTIELRGDVLGGARLDVTGKDGKISCTFHTSDANVGRLVKASEGALARAFAHKGLSLERLDVVNR
jgi:hypothetical protein